MLKEKNAIVTGARRGIGYATVKEFAEQGANIWACARKEEPYFEKEMKRLADENHVWIEPVYFDLSDDDQIKQAIKNIISERKRIDILANVAGIAHGSLLNMVTMNTLHDVFQINFFAQVQIMQLVSRCMLRQGHGSIINVSSVAGLDSEPGYIAYGSSKAALAFATKTISSEMAKSGIRVNAVAPGLLDTDMGKQIEDSAKSRMMASCSMNRLGNAEEIAKVIAFLASDDASFITGQIIRADGGM